MNDDFQRKLSGGRSPCAHTRFFGYGKSTDGEDSVRTIFVSEKEEVSLSPSPTGDSLVTAALQDEKLAGLKIVGHLRFEIGKHWGKKG